MSNLSDEILLKYNILDFCKEQFKSNYYIEEVNNILYINIDEQFVNINNFEYNEKVWSVLNDTYYMYCIKYKFNDNIRILNIKFFNAENNKLIEKNLQEKFNIYENYILSFCNCKKNY